MREIFEYVFKIVGFGYDGMSSIKIICASNIEDAVKELKRQTRNKWKKPISSIVLISKNKVEGKR